MLSATIPHRADRRLCIAGAETAAVPAPAIKARPGWAVILRAEHPEVVLRALAFDHFGRSVTRQKTVSVPVTIHMVLGHMAYRRGQCRLRQREGNRDGGDAQETPQH